MNACVDALEEAGTEVEQHVFEGEPHGFGAGSSNSNWTGYFDTWLNNIFENA